MSIEKLTRQTAGNGVAELPVRTTLPNSSTILILSIPTGATHLRIIQNSATRLQFTWTGTTPTLTEGICHLGFTAETHPIPTNAVDFRARTATTDGGAFVVTCFVSMQM